MAHDTVVEIPFHRLREDRFVPEAWAWKAKVDDLLVDHGHEVIVFPHDAIRDVEWCQGMFHDEHTILLEFENLSNLHNINEFQDVSCG